MKSNYRKLGKIISLVVITLLVVAGSFYFANELNSNDEALKWVQSLGYLGILGLSIIGGLNMIVPVPVAVFTPIFTEAGYSIYSVLTLLIIGTVIADIIGYGLGRFGRAATAQNPPQIIKTIENLIAKRPKLVVPIVTIYAAFAPLPNELILIPLGLAGFRFISLIPALIIGNIIHQLILVYGIDSIFNLIF